MNEPTKALVPAIPVPLATNGNGDKNVKGWNSLQLMFRDWLTLPKLLRVPKTQQELAPLLSVTEKTLCEWKRLPGFGESVVELKQRLLRSDDVSETLDAQVAKARTGNTRAAKLVLQAANVLGDTQSQGTGGNTLVIINDGRAHVDAIDAISE